MKSFHASILPSPLSLYTLTSATLRRKMIKGGAKVSQSLRGIKGHTHPSEHAGEFQDGEGLTFL